MTMERDSGYRALVEGAGFFPRPSARLVAMRGADRERFLNGQVTCELKGLAAGSGVYGFFTTPQGKVMSDVRVLADDERLLLELPAPHRDEVLARLEKYRIADRVEWEPLDDLAALTVAGPQASEAAGGAVGETPGEPWAHREAEVGGVAVRVVRNDLLGVPAFDLWVPREAIEAVAAALREAGAVEVPPDAVDAMRVERGAPLFGADFADHFPQETGLETKAVSYTKGCYLGQEVVARIHYRGGVNRGLVGVIYAGEGPAPGAALLHDGRPAGTAGTVAFSPALGRTAGLAVLHRRAAEPGTVLEVEGGGSAEVRALPLAGDGGKG